MHVAVFFLHSFALLFPFSEAALSLPKFLFSIFLTPLVDIKKYTDILSLYCRLSFILFFTSSLASFPFSFFFFSILSFLFSKLILHPLCEINYLWKNSFILKPYRYCLDWFSTCHIRLKEDINLLEVLSKGQDYFFFCILDKGRNIWGESAWVCICLWICSYLCLLCLCPYSYY